MSTAPVTERLHTSLTEWQTGLPHDPPVRANRTACEKLSQLKEVNNTSVERTTLELQLCETAVYASLAPAQPPPPAGLASSLLVLMNTNEYTYSVRPKFKIRAFLKTKILIAETEKHKGFTHPENPFGLRL